MDYCISIILGWLCIWACLSFPGFTITLDGIMEWIERKRVITGFSMLASCSEVRYYQNLTQNMLIEMDGIHWTHFWDGWPRTSQVTKAPSASEQYLNIHLYHTTQVVLNQLLVSEDTGGCIKWPPTTADLIDISTIMQGESSLFVKTYGRPWVFLHFAQTSSGLF